MKKSLRDKLTYSNVISTLCLFLLIGGGTAFAASQLAKKSVGTKQLKSNAVTSAKIKKNAVTSAKIKSGAVNGEKVADGSLTGADINAPSTPFSQIVQRVRISASAPFTPEPLYQIGSYTQPAGEDDQYLASLTVNFPASCEAPRVAQAYLLIDAPAKFNELQAENIAGLGVIQDKGAGTVTRTMEFTPNPGTSPLYRVAPAIPTPHHFSAALAAANCKSGGGITVSGAGVDVIGTK
jgi:hypothetical protein